MNAHPVQGPRLSLRGIGVRFGEVRALDGVSLELVPGEVTVLVGPNGAGKSTLMGVLLGLVQADEGEIALGEERSRRLSARARAHLGYLPEAVGFAENLSGRQVLRFFARARGLPGVEVERRLREVGLQAAAGRRVAGYSRGMRQRLGLAVASLGDPRLLILDEPTGGLDQQGLGVLWALLDRARARGATVLVSTHDLNLIERRADRVVVLRQGRVVAEGAPRALREECGLPLRLHLGPLEANLRAEVLARVGAGAAGEAEPALSLAPAALGPTLAALEGLLPHLPGLRVEEPGMDQVYEALLAREAPVQAPPSPSPAPSRAPSRAPRRASPRASPRAALRAGLALALHELAERARDRWVLMAGGLFVALALGVSLYGRAAGEAQGAVTAPSVVTLAAFLVPLLALILGHDAVVGERERNTLGLLLTLPIGRGGVLLAKFLGRGLALGLAASAGLFAAALALDPPYRPTIALLLLPTQALGLAFLSLGVGLSAAVRRRVTAASLAVGLWFLLVFVYDLALLLALVLSDGALSQDRVAWAVLANPAGLYRTTLLVDLVGAQGLAEMGLTVALPGPAQRALLWALWLILPLGLGGLALHSRKAVNG